MVPPSIDGLFSVIAALGNRIAREGRLLSPAVTAIAALLVFGGNKCLPSASSPCPPLTKKPGPAVAFARYRMDRLTLVPDTVAILGFCIGEDEAAYPAFNWAVLMESGIPLVPVLAPCPLCPFADCRIGYKCCLEQCRNRSNCHFANLLSGNVGI